jgi:hypothetical protein
MNWLDILFEASIQSARTLGLVIVIVVPLVTVFEILLRKKILDKISKKFSSTMRWFDLPGSALFPLIVGSVMGIAYGAGVLYSYQQKKILKTRSFNIICTILCLCHSVIEDTIIFTVIGASFVWVFGVRVIIAIIIVKILLKIGKIISKLDFFKLRR